MLREIERTITPKTFRKQSETVQIRALEFDNVAGTWMIRSNGGNWMIATIFEVYLYMKLQEVMECKNADL
jgi:hypothetical protein